MGHRHDYQYVKKYWVGGGGGPRSYWHLYRCSCGKTRRVKA